MVTITFTPNKMLNNGPCRLEKTTCEPCLSKEMALIVKTLPLGSMVSISTTKKINKIEKINCARFKYWSATIHIGPVVCHIPYKYLVLAFQKLIPFNLRQTLQSARELYIFCITSSLSTPSEVFCNWNSC